MLTIKTKHHHFSQRQKLDTWHNQDRGYFPHHIKISYAYVTFTRFSHSVVKMETHCTNSSGMAFCFIVTTYFSITDIDFLLLFFPTSLLILLLGPYPYLPSLLVYSFSVSLQERAGPPGISTEHSIASSGTNPHHQHWDGHGNPVG